MTTKLAPKNPSEEQRNLMAERVSEMKGISVAAARRQVDRKLAEKK